MWIVISQIICLAAAIGLLAIVYDFNHETPWYLRYGLLGLSTAFFGTFWMSRNRPEVYENAAAIAFSGVGVMTVAIVVYLILAKHIQPVVIRISGGALGIILFVWLIGSLSDSKRQKLQMQTQAQTQHDTTRANK